MPNTKTGGNRWVPDIRPENIDTYKETSGTDSAEYKIVDAHPIIGGILNKLAFFRTHAAAVWYDKIAGITVRDRLDDLEETMAVKTALLDISKYEWTSGDATIAKIEKTVFINLGLVCVTCDRDGVLLKIPEGFSPGKWTVFTVPYKQRNEGQFELCSMYFLNGNLCSDIALDNAYVLLVANWRV